MIIGLGHKARNGKTTIAEYLQLKYDFKILNFADGLYEECRNAPSYISLNLDYYNERDPDSKVYIEFVDDIDAEVIYEQTGASSLILPDSLKPYMHVIEDGMTEKCAPLLQWWGTNFRRKYFGDTYWIRQVELKMEAEYMAGGSGGVTPATALLADEPDFAIGDMRFTNEAEFVKNSGGETWKVDHQYIDPHRDPNHPSEIDLDDWNFDSVLMNTGTKGDLFRLVDENMKRIGGKYARLA